METPEPASPINAGQDPTRGRTIVGMARIGVLGFVAFMVVGNLVIVAAHAAAATRQPPPPAQIEGVEKLQAVDERLWRGAAPSPEGYRGLAEAGVRRIVDLRAERDVRVDEEALGRIGVELVRLPLRDGQAPSSDLVAAFLRAVETSPGLTFVHCGAGVGRTGALAAAWSSATGAAEGWDLVGRNLAIGPPSLEQIAFAARLDSGEVVSSGPVLTTVSRMLDAPRRIWTRVR